MPVDPKYAHLPGIAVDQPDVYETNDLPEDEQAEANDGESFESEAIDSISLNASDAFKKFKGAQIDGRDVDFSDNFGRKGRVGYRVEPNEFELGVEQRANENVLQRYQRLQNEVAELTDIISNTETAECDANVTPAQVGNLGEQLNSMRVEDALGMAALSSSMDPTGRGIKKALDQVGKLKVATKTTPAKTGKALSEDPLSYEVYCHSDQEACIYANKVASLVQRLQKLEVALGPAPESDSAEAGDSHHGHHHQDVMSAVRALEARTALLEPAHLDQLDARLQAINQKLNLIAEKRSVIEDADKHAKISELYDLVKKWDATCTSLPTIKNRMLALKNLHDQALQFSASLTHLDATQQQLRDEFQNSTVAMAKVERDIQANVDSVSKSCARIEERISGLKK